MTLDWTGRSLADIDNIKSYLRSRNPTAAHRTFTAIHTIANRLRRFPRSGPPGREPGTREFVVTGTPYLVVYRVSTSGIVILRVLHGRQRWPVMDP